MRQKYFSDLQKAQQYLVHNDFVKSGTGTWILNQGQPFAVAAAIIPMGSDGCRINYFMVGESPEMVGS